LIEGNLDNITAAGLDYRTTGSATRPLSTDSSRSGSYGPIWSARS